MIAVDEGLSRVRFEFEAGEAYVSLFGSEGGVVMLPYPLLVQACSVCSELMLDRLALDKRASFEAEVQLPEEGEF
jgi:hypothetical protein